MISAKGNMWSRLADCYVITTNQYVTNAGNLVMGRGAAAQAKRLFPGSDTAFGSLVKNHGMQFPYYLLCAGKWDQSVTVTGLREHTPIINAHLWAFQVKLHWREEARLSLIRNSALCLKRYAQHYSNLSWFLNFPGIGNGGLRRADVLPLIQCLPDNVTVWELD